ncbi:hypothetical protein G6011_02642 [Alternaria panax]|uniref:Uncharacterized protein n=1 Tax=Alternaria panax TaxID=48097 RepID=A0AAD4I722_9PLEO|nr:hypothetical protein G6011_02642 [Alternaria panax]
MAAPARPNVTGDYVNSVTVYQSLDGTDEAIFNRLTTQYERAAFKDIIATWRSQFEAGFTGAHITFTTDNDIQAMWLQKRQ